MYNNGILITAVDHLEGYPFTEYPYARQGLSLAHLQNSLARFELDSFVMSNNFHTFGQAFCITSCSLISFGLICPSKDLAANNTKLNMLWIIQLMTHERKNYQREEDGLIKRDAW